jgi:hypothetical protein
MKVELITKRHLKILKTQTEEMYTKKFPWADPILLETLIDDRVTKIINEIDEDDYLKDLEDEEDDE